MQGFGERLRSSARQIGWSDAEVARRVGLAQARYANYVTDRHEPDLVTLLRICSDLGMSASDLLEPSAQEPDEAARLRGRIAATAHALGIIDLAVLVAVADGLLARQALTPLPASPSRSNDVDGSR